MELRNCTFCSKFYFAPSLANIYFLQRLTDQVTHFPLCYKENWPKEKGLVIQSNSTSYEPFEIQDRLDINQKSYNTGNLASIIQNVLDLLFFRRAKFSLICFLACRVSFSILHVYTVSCKNSPVFLNVKFIEKLDPDEQFLHPEFSRNLNFRGLCCQMKEDVNFEVYDFLYVILSALQKSCTSKFRFLFS